MEEEEEEEEEGGGFLKLSRRAGTRFIPMYGIASKSISRGILIVTNF